MNNTLIAKVYIWYPCTKFPAGHVAIGIVQEPEVHSDDGFGMGSKLINYTSFFGPLYSRGQGFIAFSPDDSDGVPDRKYSLKDPNVDEMMKEMDYLYINRPSYDVLSSNCATIVSKILKKGMPAYTPHHIIWTPKNIAQWCDKLRDIGKATKTKMQPSSKLNNPIKTLLRLR